MQKRTSDRKKSEIVDLYMKGWTRDDIAGKTGVSAGGVSGIIKEFTDCVDCSSLNDAAEEYGVVETAENLRDLAVKVRRNKTSIEELVGLSSILERIRKLVPLEKLEEFIKAGESLGDKAHVEASVRMHMIEEDTGRSHDDILADLESKEAKVKDLSSEIQRLNAEVKNLEDKKANLAEEEGESLKQHKLTMAKVEHISEIESELSKHDIDLTKPERLQPVLDAVEEAGYDPKKIVEQIRKEGSLKAQIEADNKNLADIEEHKAKLYEILASYEDKIREIELLVEKADTLVSMGWNYGSLDKAIKLTKEAGSPEEVLNRLELLKPSAEAKAELERTRTEIDKLKVKDMKQIKETTKSLSALVDEKIPNIVAETSNLTNKCSNLAEKYNKLQADFSKLDEEYRKCQKSLDDAISWSLLLREPEKLPSDRIGHIFFDVMLPRLETWCKSKNNKERLAIAGEMAKKTICLYAEPAANFMKTPEKASLADTMGTVASFAAAAMPFYAALMKWYALHKHEGGASKLFSIQYHLEEFFEGISKL